MGGGGGARPANPHSYTCVKTRHFVAIAPSIYKSPQTYICTSPHPSIHVHCPIHIHIPPSIYTSPQPYTVYIDDPSIYTSPQPYTVYIDDPSIYTSPHPYINRPYIPLALFLLSSSKLRRVRHIEHGEESTVNFRAILNMFTSLF